MPNLPRAPLASGTRQAGCWQQPLTGSAGSKDCNLGSATPSDARGNRRIIVGRPRSWQGSPPGPLGGRVKSLGAKSPSHVPAHPPVSLAGAGTYLPCWV